MDQETSTNAPAEVGQAAATESIPQQVQQPPPPPEVQQPAPPPPKMGIDDLVVNVLRALEPGVRAYANAMATRSPEVALEWHKAQVLVLTPKEPIKADMSVKFTNEPGTRGKVLGILNGVAVIEVADQTIRQELVENLEELSEAEALAQSSGS